MSAREPSLLDRPSPSAPAWPRDTTGLAEGVACGLCGRVRAFGTPFCDHGAGEPPPARWVDSTTLAVGVEDAVDVQEPNVDESEPLAVELLSRDGLRAELRAANLPVRGSVDELRARLSAHRDESGTRDATGGAG